MKSTAIAIPQIELSILLFDVAPLFGTNDERTVSGFDNWANLLERAAEVQRKRVFSCS